MQSRGIEKSVQSIFSFRRKYHDVPHLIFCGGEGMRTAVLSLKKIGFEPPVTLVSHSSWISSIHPDWYYNRWGQGPFYLPPELFKIFKSSYPDHSLDEPMHFEQIRTIFLSLEQRIRQDSSIDLITQKISAIQQGQYDVKIIDQSEKVISSFAHHNFHLYHSAKTPKILVDSNLPLASFSEIYAYGKREIAEKRHVVMVGSGLNTSWALRDLNISIIYLIPRSEQPRDELIKNDNCLCAINMHDEFFQINPYSDSLYELIGKDLKSNRILTLYVDAKSFYASMGNEFNKKIIQVDSSKVCHVDTSAKVSNLINYTNFQGERIVKPSDMRGTQVPDGNLTHVHYSSVGSIPYIPYPTHNPQSALNDFSKWKKNVIKKIQDHHQVVHPEFFDSFFDLLKYGNTSMVLSHKKLWKIMEIAYIKAHPKSQSCFFQSKDKYLSWEQFKKIVLQERTLASPKSLTRF